MKNRRLKHTWSFTWESLNMSLVFGISLSPESILSPTVMKKLRQHSWWRNSKCVILDTQGTGCVGVWVQNSIKKSHIRLYFPLYLYTDSFLLLRRLYGVRVAGFLRGKAMFLSIEVFLLQCSCVTNKPGPGTEISDTKIEQLNNKSMNYLAFIQRWEEDETKIEMTCNPVVSELFEWSVKESCLRRCYK